MEADHARQAPARASVDHTVKIDEADGLADAVRMRDARTQPAGDEREV
jgi:hypothetical protein